MSPGRTCLPDTLFAAALRGERVELHDDGACHPDRPLAVDRWNRADDSDRYLLASCRGTTLDVGCGPGRMTAELGSAGIRALGVDVVPEAVRQTRARGALALLRDVFDPVPGEGRWGSVLLADGNVGIGGDPLRLLRRSADLVAPGGRVVVDLRPPGRRAGVRSHHLAGGGMVSESFRWAVVGTDSIRSLARRAGLVVRRTDRVGDRWFAVLEKPR